MLPFLLSTFLLAAADEPPPARPVPELARSPKVDGVLGDFRRGLPLTAKPLEGASAQLTGRLGAFRDTLYVALEVQDEAITDRDRVTLALHFPEAGVTAGGAVFRFGPGGKLDPRPEDGVSPGTLALVDAAVHRTKKGMSLEVALPARALPRFPARDALVLELCLSYDDADDAGPAAKEISTCVTGAPPPEVQALPSGFRQGLRPRPPPEGQSVEGRPGGWVGYHGQVDPGVLGDRPLNEQSLRVLVAEAPSIPRQCGSCTVPDAASGRQGAAGGPHRTGPFGVDESCAPEREMRLAVFWVKGRVGERSWTGQR
jgi:hypothetical protein